MNEDDFKESLSTELDYLLYIRDQNLAEYLNLTKLYVSNSISTIVMGLVIVAMCVLILFSKGNKVALGISLGVICFLANFATNNICDSFEIRRRISQLATKQEEFDAVIASFEDCIDDED